ncbi:transmembrane protein 69-like [Gouania willdenowi]|uniref:Transmembrane protein 69-like n=1 Tax=Gouania willdenowi TaxID=441366 RepID=A0A8C5HZK0_GOUWI|nr:transmembrane protein 69-like [Gouania willdenowi]XP_028329056.1 transmembrane protein 69-like [Gouania willdenowi]
MIILAPGRRIMAEVPSWRLLQPIIRAATFSTKVPLLYPCSTSFIFKPPRHSSTCRLLRVWPVSWHASRLTSQDSNIKEGFSLKAITKSPKPALYLGCSGLIPFISAPLLMVATQSFYPEVAYAQMVYGASIVSFLGGARWGFAIPEGSPAQPDWRNLGNSVVPSLIAWLALVCRDNIAEGALVVIMGLGLSLYYDLTLLPGYPSWFKAMRTVLTLVATFSLVATLALKKFCTERKLTAIQK